MSDFDDELLELAEVGSEKKRKKHKASKKRKADVSDYEGPESEEEELSDPYPLEGKYVDEFDRENLLSKNEIEREEILALRAEERQAIQTRIQVRAMANQQNNGADKGAKRQRTAVGATHEKTKKLDELKARRQAKGDRKKTDGSPRRDDSPMDTGSSEYEDDAQADRPTKSSSSHSDTATLDDFNRCCVTRDLIVKHFLAPWFEEYITNSWVRFLIGTDRDNGTGVYRMCEVAALVKDKVKPYKIGNTTIDIQLELRHGKSCKHFQLDRVSNAHVTEREYARLKATCEEDSVALPSRQTLHTKSARNSALVSQVMTEADVAARLSRKKEIEAATGFKTNGWITMERSKLKQQITIASRRQDYAELATLEAQLVEFSRLYGGEQIDTPKNNNDMLAMLSAKNRKANQETVRKAEIVAARERKLNKQNGTQDPSARLKTMPRTFADASLSASTSRAGTPGAPAKSSPGPSKIPADTAPYDVAKTFQSSIVDSIEVDLGDF